MWEERTRKIRKNLDTEVEGFCTLIAVIIIITLLDRNISISTCINHVTSIIIKSINVQKNERNMAKVLALPTAYIVLIPGTTYGSPSTTVSDP